MHLLKIKLQEKQNSFFHFFFAVVVVVGCKYIIEKGFNFYFPKQGKKRMKKLRAGAYEKKYSEYNQISIVWKRRSSIGKKKMWILCENISFSLSSFAYCLLKYGWNIYTHTWVREKIMIKEAPSRTFNWNTWGWGWRWAATITLLTLQIVGCALNIRHEKFKCHARVLLCQDRGKENSLCAALKKGLGKKKGP